MSQTDNDNNASEVIKDLTIIECWCPCRCGCAYPEEPLEPSGLCQDCIDGNHEVPPAGVKLGGVDAVEAMVPILASMLKQYREVLIARSTDGRTKRELFSDLTIIANRLGSDRISSEERINLEKNYHRIKDLWEKAK